MAAGTANGRQGHGAERPGRLGAPLDPRAAAGYLEALGRWREDRQRELDQLDQAALAARDGAQLTGDIMLSMALWKAVSDRYELLLATWDSGRVGQAERERMASLIWGRLDATPDPSVLARVSQQAPTPGGAAGLAVSLPEACRLSDALVSQLRVRLALDPSGTEITDRLQAGERVDLEEYIAHCPEAADRIRRLVPALEVLGSESRRAQLLVLARRAAGFFWASVTSRRCR